MAEIKDIIKFAKDTMKKYYEEGKIKHFVVSWVSKSYSEEDLGKVSYLTLCEKEIHNEIDFDKWMMRIQITTKSKILWVKDGEIRDFDDVFREIMNDEISDVALCVKLVKKYELRNGKSLYLCRIFNAWGVYESFLPKPDGYHEWIHFQNDKACIYKPKLTLFTSKKEAEKEILLKLLGGNV